jgi:hypothetical protein
MLVCHRHRPRFRAFVAALLSAVSPCHQPPWGGIMEQCGSACAGCVLKDNITWIPDNVAADSGNRKSAIRLRRGYAGGVRNPQLACRSLGEGRPAIGPACACAGRRVRAHPPAGRRRPLPHRVRPAPGRAAHAGELLDRQGLVPRPQRAAQRHQHALPDRDQARRRAPRAEHRPEVEPHGPPPSSTARSRSSP